jgi:16S rRNA (uracil1498-N3)-methyltransferase
VPSFLADTSDIDQDQLTLRGDELHHLRVRRCQVGEVIEVIDGRGGFFRVRIEAIERERATGVILARVPERGEAEVDLTLACALIKGDRFDSAVEKGTEIGVRTILPLRCRRSIARDTSRTKLERWRRIAQEAAKQSGRSRIPEVKEPVDFDAELTGHSSHGSLRLMAVARAEMPSLRQAVEGVSCTAEGVTLFIGPEGGFEPEEEQQAMAAGVRAFAWGGDHTLRVDTAAVALSALVLYQLGGYGGHDADN